MDITYTPVVFFDAMSMAVAFAPIVVLAALAVIDLRAVMLLRAMRLWKRRIQPGDLRISGDEWSATA